MLKGLTEEEYALLVLSVGTHRGKRHLTPIGVAKLLDKASNNNEMKDIVTSLELSSGMIKKFLSLLLLPIEIQKLISFGSNRGCISFTSAFEISKIKNQEERFDLTKSALENNLNKSEVQAIVQRVNRSELSVNEALGEIMKLRPEIEHSYLFVAEIPKSIEENEKIIQAVIRKKLATLIGGSNILSISVNDDRVALLLNDSAINNPAIKEKLEPENLNRFIEELIIEY